MIAMENILIRYNTFKHGMTLNHLTTTQTYSSVRVIGNIMGKASTCESGSGLAYDRNVWVKGSPGCGEANFKTVAWDADDPLATYSEGSRAVQDRLHPVSNFHLGARAYAFENWIKEVTGDYALAKDIDGHTRTSGSRDAGADERRRPRKRSG